MSDYPPDWEVLSLGEVVEKITSGGTPKADNPDLYGGNIPFLKIDDITSSSKYLRNHKVTINERGLSESSAKIVPTGTLLLTMYGTIGRCCITTYPVATNQAIASFLGHPRVELEYLYYALESKADEFAVASSQTTQANISAGILKQTPIAIPPLPEQKKIAEILSGIDNQMELLQKGVKAKQNLRSALLSELIAKDAPITKLDSVASRVSGHTPSKSHSDYWNGGIPWISLTDTSKLDNRYISHTAKEISKEGIKNSSAVLHPPGLVILSRDARVGCSAITTKSMAVSQHFVGWICSEKLLNKYLYYLLQKWKPKFEAIAMGSTIPTIGVPFFRDLEIPVPPMVIQERISETLESVDREIEALSNKVAMLRVLKSGVSSDLLSGRKRVSV
jgi:type I restriction enzyme S subunit